ncbi:MAG: hypothetical protein QOH47_995 [Sphingomonadales bacterium]|jgi:hypothetical protein|nr:hypothetical protein [Sphingomonadales bacterium]
MLRRLLLPIAVALVVMTPVLAQTTPADPVVTEANQQKARAEALEAQYKAQKAQADALVAPLARFAGDGTSHVETGGGQMEAAYLAAVSMRDVANVINRRVQEYVVVNPAAPEPVERTVRRARRTAAPADDRDTIADKIDILANMDREPDDGSQPAEAASDAGAGDFTAAPEAITAPSSIVLLTEQEAFSFDSYAAFETEARGIVAASLGVLGESGPTCRPPRVVRQQGNPENFLLPVAGATAAIGAVMGLLQSETHVYGFSDLGDDGMLVSALTAGGENSYIRQAALLSAAQDEADPVNVQLQRVADCEADLRARIQSMPHADDAQKAAIAPLQAVLTRLTGFIERLTAPAADGNVRLAAVLRQSQLRRTSSPYVLRVHVNRAGGTMITRKNLWTALGAPAIVLSGGVIASYSLSNRRTGAVLLGGTVVCRTGLTGLRSALALQSSDLVCAENPPRATAANAPIGRRHAARLGYDDSVFRLAEPER